MSDEQEPTPPGDESAAPAESASAAEGASPDGGVSGGGEQAAAEVAERSGADAPAGPATTESAAPSPEAASPPAASPPVAPLVEAAKPAEGTHHPSYVFLGVVSVVSLALDLGSKWWAKARLEDAKSYVDRHIEVIPNYFSFAFARNKGGAWGLLQNEPESIRRPFFLGISVLAVLFIVSLYRRLTPQQTALKWGLPLVLGGALGNLVNRIQYNFVVDFIDVYYKTGHEEHHWPTFNIADVAIVVGVGLMAVDMFTSRRPVKTSAAADVSIAPVPPPAAADKPSEAPPPAAGA
ncbi:MAG: signal peptidase II [Byssovorax sp.]